MKKKILIIGGTGFLGQNLIKRLHSKDFLISSISSKSKSYKKRYKKRYKKVKYIFLDFTKKKNLKFLKKEQFKYVINLGGNINHKNKIQTFNAHYAGCKNILESLNLKTLKLFIQIGSSLEYGNLNSPQIENSQKKVISIYGKAKQKASKFIYSFSKTKKINFIILRLYQVYGPYQKTDRLISSAIYNCLKNKNFECTEGKQERDFLYVDDFVDLILKILKDRNRIKSGIYNVGSGKPIKVKYIIEKISNMINKGKPIFGAIKMRKDEINSLYPSINKIKKNLNWGPKTNILNGIKKTIKFYRLNYNLK